VKSTVIFRGREAAHSDIGRRILNRLAAELTETALVEVAPRQEGMTMVQILTPKKEVPKKETPAPKAAKPRKAAAQKPAPVPAGVSGETQESAE